MSLSVENIYEIKEIIVKSKISNEQMRDNLIDHLCCATEAKMKIGDAFPIALATALKELAPNGFAEIELECYVLLNSKSVTMKKLTYSLGLFFSVCASFGLVLKILHYPGANELLIVGNGGIATIFLPLFLASKKKTALELIDKVALVSLSLICIGGALKVMHLASSNEFLLVGFLLFSLGFLPMKFLRLYRESIAS
jgi:hypothetical protein